jgi:hypothetical protein
MLFFTFFPIKNQSYPSQLFWLPSFYLYFFLLTGILPFDSLQSNLNFYSNKLLLKIFTDIVNTRNIKLFVSVDTGLRVHHQCTAPHVAHFILLGSCSITMVRLCTTVATKGFYLQTSDTTLWFYLAVRLGDLDLPVLMTPTILIEKIKWLKVVDFIYDNYVIIFAHTKWTNSLWTINLVVEIL